MRSRLSLTLLASSAIVLSLAAQGARAQTTPPAPPAPATAAPTDPVVAIVNGDDVHLSDLSALTRNLPQQLQGMTPDQLYPILLEQLVDQKAMAIAANKQGLENDPEVKKRIAAGIEQVMQAALITKSVGPEIGEAQIQARYKSEYADKPGVEEVHARHILVATQAEAEDIIKQLNHGGDFGKLAIKDSKDPGASNGGDLGFFKKTDMVPEFANAAFALKDGQITPTPVHTQFGYHVIQVLGHKTDAAPALADVHDKIRNELIQEGVHRLLAQVRSAVTIKEFGPDGQPLPPQPAIPAAPATGN
ncbi:peptidylprolyl isomerase [Acidisoma cladoniae]|uniref:peptidylprolyl isomerase n=1 Tax=Acidisoma cladoniae TaxID=3040935 RepID=UPI00255091A7|nr:peptidylprolyl isomerase [Acidisoma sp. PAMC 29798]